MIDQLPRQTYKTQADTDAEDRIAARFASWALGTQVKIGADRSDQMKPRIDRALLRYNTITAFFEVKRRGTSFGYYPAGWMVGLDKVEALRQATLLHRVVGLFVIEFSCGTLAYLNAANPYAPCQFGRTDRGDKADIERGALFRWHQFRECIDQKKDPGISAGASASSPLPQGALEVAQNL